MNKTSFPVVLLAVLALAPAAAVAQAPSLAAETHKRVIPLPPGELLKLLPAVPDQWKLKQSNAKNAVMDWASSQAQREFSYTPPPVPDAPPLPTHFLRFTVIDTGYYAGLMYDLQNPQPPKPGEAESLTVSGFPARRSMVNKTYERLRILIKSRYILQLDVQNEPAGTAQKWLSIVDLTKFAALPVDGEGNLTSPYTIIHIDEVDPKNNSVSKAYFTTQEDADRPARRH